MQDCPIINISSQQTNEEISAKIHEALTTWGGFLCEGHGISQELCDKMFQYSQMFFSLPQKTKDSIHLSKGGAAWRGYMPYGGERSESGKVEDLKEG